MTEKEKLELMNLRNRLRCQKDEINRLLEANITLRRRLITAEGSLLEIRSRCMPGAERYFDNHQFGLLQITAGRKGKDGEERTADRA